MTGERDKYLIVAAFSVIVGAVVGLVPGIGIGWRIHSDLTPRVLGAVRPPEAVTAPSHMPDSDLTPGATLEVKLTDLCQPGYSSTVRNVSSALKKQVFERYGVKSPKPGEYEIDHLISLELGGSNDISNLWPQRYQGEWNAHMKDRLENKMHQLVCQNKLDLKTAQREISEDWVEAYEKYISN